MRPADMPLPGHNAVGDAEFVGRAVLVTGGGSGIGRAAAQQFAAAGAKVLVADLDADGAIETVDCIRARGGTAHHTRVDVSDEGGVDDMVALAVGEFGGLDCAFNNAGISLPRSALTELSLSDWHRMIEVNLTSVFLCMRAELRCMGDAGGAIVNTSSTAGLRPPPRVAAYAAAKHAVIGLTKSAAGEYAGTNIRINSICPGGTDTPLLRGSIGNDPSVAQRWAQRPISTADEVAATAVWLCSDAARAISGAAVVVDRGLMFT